MRTLTTRFLIAVLFACPASCCLAESVDLPVPALQQQGKIARFKQFIKLKSNVFVKGQSHPFDMSMSMYFTQKYGYFGKDGLMPVTTGISFGQMTASMNGKSFKQDIAKAAGVPKMPSITTFYDRKGQPRSVRVTGLPGTSGAPGSFTTQLQETPFTGPFPFSPSGQLELGRTVRQSFDLPVGDGKMAAVIAFTPTRVVTIAGEPAVEVQLEGDLDLDALMSYFKSVPNAPASIAGGGHALISGTVNIGLASGEPIRHDITGSIFFDVSVAGERVAGDVDVVIGGYRMGSHPVKTAKR